MPAMLFSTSLPTQDRRAANWHDRQVGDAHSIVWRQHGQGIFEIQVRKARCSRRVCRVQVNHCLRLRTSTVNGQMKR